MEYNNSFNSLLERLLSARHWTSNTVTHALFSPDFERLLGTRICSKYEAPTVHFYQVLMNKCAALILRQIFARISFKCESVSEPPDSAQGPRVGALAEERGVHT